MNFHIVLHVSEVIKEKKMIDPKAKAKFNF